MPSPNQRRYGPDREKMLAIQRKSAAKYYNKCRAECFAHYGGFRCVGCGTTDELVLSLDHIDGKGPKPRKANGGRLSGKLFYAWLRKRGFSVGFRVLCANCQIRAKAGVL